MSQKTALITGITGQDGAILCGLLVEKGYRVIGMRPYLPVDDLENIKALGLEPEILHGDLLDSGSLVRVLEQAQPDEIYNLGALSHVQASFAMPELTHNINALGVTRLIEAMRITGLSQSARFYQASSSEMYGNAPAPQNEETPFAPVSPYGIAKLSAYWSVRNFREADGAHASNGILFNHESALRGEQFVTRKITRAVGEFVIGRKAPLLLGNLEAQRDWGHARDYMRGAWMMLQQDKPADYILANGAARSVRAFAEAAFAARGWQIDWDGEGIGETGRDRKTGQVMIAVDPSLFRAQEINCLIGDAALARETLGWSPDYSFEQLVAEMVDHDAPVSAQRRYG